MPQVIEDESTLTIVDDDGTQKKFPKSQLTPSMQDRLRSLAPATTAGQRRAQVLQAVPGYDAARDAAWVGGKVFDAASEGIGKVVKPLIYDDTELAAQNAAAAQKRNPAAAPPVPAQPVKDDPAKYPPQPVMAVQGASIRTSVPVDGMERFERELARSDSNYQKQVNTAVTAISGSQQRQLEAINRGAEKAQEQAAQELELVRQRDQQAAAHDLETQNREKERQQTIEDDMAKLTEMQAEVKEMKIDPQRSVKENKFGWAIAMALGAMGSARTGAPNYAMQLRQAQIDADIEAQKAELGNKKDAANIQMNLLGLNRARFGDERQAEAATRIALLDKYKNLVDQTALKFKSDDINNKAALEIERVNQEQAKHMLEIQDRAANKATQSIATRAEIAAKRQSLSIDALEAVGKAAGKDLSVPGLSGQALNPELQTKVAEYKGNSDAFQQEIDRLIGMIEKYGKENPLSANRASMRTLAGAVGLDYSKLMAMGAFDEGTRRKLDEMFSGDPGEILAVNALAKFKELKQLASIKSENYFKSKMRGYESEPESQAVVRE